MALTKVSNNMFGAFALNAEGYNGANAGEKIAAAIDDLPLAGGVIDARSFTGTQTFGSDIFASRSKPFVLMLGNAIYEIDMSTYSLSLNSHQKIEMYGTTFQPDVDGTTATSAGQGFITPEIFQTTGTATSGSSTMTLASTTNLEVGCIIALDGGQGTFGSDTSSTLSSGISDSDTSIPLSDASYFSAVPYTIIIGSEIITGTTKVGNSLTGVTRGAYGTTAVSHSSSDPVTFSNYWRGIVESISGSTITLSGNVTTSVTNARVLFGSTNISITGTGVFNGRQFRAGADPSANVYGIYFNYASSCHVGDDITFKNWDHGGIALVSSWYNYVGGSYFGNGRPSDSLGGNIWLFRSSSFNVINPQRITDSWGGIFIDDRTGTLNLADGSCNKNTINCSFINTESTCLGLSGVSQNVAYLGSMSSNNDCVDMTTNPQSATPRNCNKNTVFAGHASGNVSARDSHEENYIEIGSSNNSPVMSGSTSYISIKRGTAAGEYFGTGTGVKTNAVVLIDGVTAPSTVAGLAQIYVDTSDGDLKIKFGDGTVKTISTDT